MSPWLRNLARAGLRARGFSTTRAILASEASHAKQVGARIDAVRVALERGEIEALIETWRTESPTPMGPEPMGGCEAVEYEPLEQKLHALCDNIIAAPEAFAGASVAEQLLRWALIEKGLERTEALNVLALVADSRAYADAPIWRPSERLERHC